MNKGEKLAVAVAIMEVVVVVGVSVWCFRKIRNQIKKQKFIKGEGK